MELLRWDLTLQVGVPHLDNEHRLICAQINELLRVADVAAGLQPQLVAQALAKLDESIRQHFASEERLLQESGYPQLAAHQQAHRQLLARLDRVRDRDDLPMSLELAEFMRRWFVEHLQSEDRQYVTFLSQR